MSRLVLFLLGLLIGAAGVYALFWTGTLGVPSASPTPVPVVTEAGAPASSASVGAAAIASNAIVPPELAAAPAPSTSVAPAPATSAALPPLPEPVPAIGAAPTASVETAPDAPTPEGTAAVTAAVVVADDSLVVPVQGIKPTALLDTYTQSRGDGRLHDAIDIMAPRGTPVVAVADGKVAKLFNSVRGGLTVYQFDREEKLAYYYAHLDRYAPGLTEGQMLKRGEVLGYVGSTGNANPAGPHLHFAVFVLGPEKRWWKGTAVNPYPLLGGR